jgi:hypothetical protein
VTNSNYDLVELPGRPTAHHIGSSSSKPNGGSWIGELRKAIGKHDLICARNGCRKSATLGAHIRGTEAEEWRKAFRNLGILSPSI